MCTRKSCWQSALQADTNLLCWYLEPRKLRDHVSTEPASADKPCREARWVTSGLASCYHHHLLFFQLKGQASGCSSLQGPPEQQQGQAHISRLHFSSRLCMWGHTSSLQGTETCTKPLFLPGVSKKCQSLHPLGLGIAQILLLQTQTSSYACAVHTWVVGGQTTRGCIYLGSPALRHCGLLLLHFSYNISQQISLPAVLWAGCCSHDFKACSLRLNWSLAPVPLYLFKITFCVGKISFSDKLHMWTGTFSLPQRDNALNPCCCLESAKSIIFHPHHLGIGWIPLPWTCRNRDPH